MKVSARQIFVRDLTGKTVVVSSRCRTMEELIQSVRSKLAIPIFFVLASTTGDRIKDVSEIRANQTVQVFVNNTVDFNQPLKGLYEFQLDNEDGVERIETYPLDNKKKKIFSQLFMSNVIDESVLNSLAVAIEKEELNLFSQASEIYQSILENAVFNGKREETSLFREYVKSRNEYCLFKQGDLGAIEKNKEIFDIYYGNSCLAMINIKEGKFASALGNLNKILDDDSLLRYQRPLLIRGKLNELLGEEKKSMIDYKRVLTYPGIMKKKNFYYNTLIAYSRLCSKMGNYEEAKKDLEKHPKVILEFANVLNELGNVDESFKLMMNHFSQMDKVIDENILGEALLMWSSVYFLQGNFNESLNHLLKFAKFLQENCTRFKLERKVSKELLKKIVKKIEQEKAKNFESNIVDFWSKFERDDTNPSFKFIFEEAEKSIKIDPIFILNHSEFLQTLYKSHVKKSTKKGGDIIVKLKGSFKNGYQNMKVIKEFVTLQKYQNQANGATLFDRNNIVDCFLICKTLQMKKMMNYLIDVAGNIILIIKLSNDFLVMYNFVLNNAIKLIDTEGGSMIFFLLLNNIHGNKEMQKFMDERIKLENNIKLMEVKQLIEIFPLPINLGTHQNYRTISSQTIMFTDCLSFSKNHENLCKNVKLIARDGEINVHEIILQLYSDFFKLVLRHDTKEEMICKIDIPIKLLHVIVEYMYTQKFSMTISKLEEVTELNVIAILTYLNKFLFFRLEGLVKIKYLEVLKEKEAIKE